MGAGAAFKGAISNILRYNSEPTKLLSSRSDGKTEALNFDSNYLLYLEKLRDHIQVQIDTSSVKPYLDHDFYTKVQVDGIIPGFIDSAPEQLNPLNEL